MNAPPKRPVATTASPKTPTECCHCSGPRQLSPGSHTVSTVTNTAPTPQDMPHARASKKRRYESTDISRAHKHLHISAQPVHQHRVSRTQGAHHPGKYTRHSPNPPLKELFGPRLIPSYSTRYEFPSLIHDPAHTTQQPSK